MDRKNLKNLLEKYGIKPSRKMGQSFLVDETTLEILAKSLRMNANNPDVVIEIGCGPGNYTEFLLHEGMKVIAIERDRRLGTICHRRLKNHGGLLIVLADATLPPLKQCLSELSGKIAVTGNIPYSITGKFLKEMKTKYSLAKTASIVLQEEVANRILAKPKEKNYGAMTLLVNLNWNPEKGILIQPEKFYPHPKVFSRQVILKKKEKNIVEPQAMQEFEKFVVEIFKHRRKTIINSLMHALITLKNHIKDAKEILRQAEIDTAVRPEELSLDDFIRIFKEIEK